MVGLEEAAEQVAKLSGMEKIALFEHYDDVFKLNDKQYREDGGKAISMFAQLCGFAIAYNVK